MALLKRIAAAMLAAVACVWATAFAAEDAPFKAQSFTLANGMEVVVIPDRRAPVVTHMVWYRAGSSDDPRGVSGIAHFFEHLMFRGTKTVPDQEFDKIITRNGGEHNANTSTDRTVYYQRVASDRLDLVMRLEADRMRNLTFNADIVATERKVILEERSQTTDNNPGGQFWEQMNAALYLSHPYGIPVLGWRNEMEKLSLEDAQDFYRTHYAPNNAILVVAGDVRAADVLALAEKHYGKIPRRALAERVRLTEPPQLAARRLSMKHKDAGNPLLSRLYLAPSWRTAEGNRGYALQVLAYVLTGAGDQSRMGKVLVKDQKLATTVSVWWSGTNIDHGSFGIYAEPAPGVSFAQLEAGIDAEISRIIAEGPTADELQRAKTVMQANAIYARDSQESMAEDYGESLAIGLSVADVEAWPERIAAVSADDVKAAAVAVFQIAQSVTGTLEPDGTGTGQSGAGGPPSGKTQR